MKYVFYISKSGPDEWTTYRRDTEKLNGDSWHLPKGDEPAEQFDVPRVLAKLKDDPELREKSEGRCQFRQVHIDGREIEVICVMTDYSHAAGVAGAIGRLLYDEPGVSLFDAERGMMEISKWSDIPDEGFIAARQAYRRYRSAIIQKFLPQRNYAARVAYFKIDEECMFNSLHITVSVTALEGDFKECISRFDSVIREVAGELGDEVDCKSGCFSVCRNDWYLFNFVLEGVGKCPQWLGWMDDGQPKMELLNRCGIWKTRKAIAKLPKGEMEHIQSRLHNGEDLVANSCERNLADRFVNSYKLSRMIAKHGFDIVYGDRPNEYHALVSFDISARECAWDSEDTFSAIHFCEEELSYVLLGVINEIIPSYWDYFYERFYVRPDEACRIEARMKEVREIVRKNPCDPVLGGLVDWLMRSPFADDWGSFPEEMDFDEARKKSLFKHRCDLVAFYDMFIRWLDCACHGGFFVTGA